MDEKAIAKEYEVIRPLIHKIKRNTHISVCTNK